MPTHIIQTSGDLFKADVEALVNAVNTVGVMGKGIALQFREAFPENYRAYKAACDRGEVQPGRMFITEITGSAMPRYLINFPTKRHFRDRSRMEDIDSGLVALVHEVQTRGIRSLAMPALGCGLGGSDWEEVRPRIEAAFAPLDSVQVLLYGPLP